MSTRRVTAVPAILAGVVLVAAGGLLSGAAPSTPWVLDKAAEAWVARTFKAMSLDDKVGQLLTPTFESGYIATDSDEFERLARLVKEQRVGGLLVFGGSEAVPGVLLNPTYGAVTLGNPLNAASMYSGCRACRPSRCSTRLTSSAASVPHQGWHRPNNGSAVGDEQSPTSRDASPLSRRAPLACTSTSRLSST